MKRHIPLAAVAEPRGRLDVLCYQVAARFAERIEREQGIAGLREHLLPLLEKVIVSRVPAEPIVSDNLAALIKVLELNRLKARGDQ